MKIVMNEEQFKTYVSSVDEVISYLDMATQSSEKFDTLLDTYKKELKINGYTDAQEKVLKTKSEKASELMKKIF